MRGDLVIVRAYGGMPLIRLVWEEDERGVYITDDARFKLLVAGEASAPSVGFPMEDVFKYDAELAATIRDLFENGELDWDALVPYHTNS